MFDVCVDMQLKAELIVTRSDSFCTAPINFSGHQGCCVFVFFLCVVMAVDAVMVGKFSLGPRVCSGHYNKQVWDPPEKVGVLKYLIKHPTTLMEMRNTIINYFSLNGKLAKFGRCNNQHITTNTIYTGWSFNNHSFQGYMLPPKTFWNHPHQVKTMRRWV